VPERLMLPDDTARGFGCESQDGDEDTRSRPLLRNIYILRMEPHAEGAISSSTTSAPGRAVVPRSEQHKRRHPAEALSNRGYHHYLVSPVLATRRHCEIAFRITRSGDDRASMARRRWTRRVISATGIRSSASRTTCCTSAV